MLQTCSLLRMPVLEATNQTNYLFRLSLLLSSLYFSIILCISATQRLPDDSLEADDRALTMKQFKHGAA